MYRVNAFIWIGWSNRIETDNLSGKTLLEISECKEIAISTFN